MKNIIITIAIFVTVSVISGLIIEAILKNKKPCTCEKN